MERREGVPQLVSRSGRMGGDNFWAPGMYCTVLWGEEMEKISPLLSFSCPLRISRMKPRPGLGVRERRGDGQDGENLLEGREDIMVVYCQLCLCNMKKRDFSIPKACSLLHILGHVCMCVLKFIVFSHMEEKDEGEGGQVGWIYFHMSF